VSLPVVRRSFVDRAMHLVVEAFNVLDPKAADAGRELHGVNQPRLFPPAKRVLVHSETARGFADT
jgi:hypothetical protein